MLTKHEGRNYVILYERQTVPEKLNKNKVGMCRGEHGIRRGQ